MKTLIGFAMTGLIFGLMQTCQAEAATIRQANIQSARDAMIEIGLLSVRVERVERPARPLPRHNPRASLAGFCNDHRQIALARDFAYDIQGLNLSSREAISWALDYNHTHRCGTIGEFRARFETLYRVAYDIDGLNLSSSEARRFALERAEFTPVGKAHLLADTLKTVKNFLYAIDGMNLGSSDAKSRARQWIDRFECEDARYVQDVIAPAFREEYRFAYAIDGLNLSSSDAREYASRQIWNLSRCSDLLQP
jgi:hypothetical protein